MITGILTGDEVRAIRKELGLSQAELATELGYEGSLRRQRISRVENGHEIMNYAKANLLLAIKDGYKPRKEPA